MYKKELQNLLNLSNFPNYFLLFGSETYELETYAKEILSKLNNENILSLYFDEYSFSTAKYHLMQNSLFGSSNTLYIKTDKKIPSKELKELIKFCLEKPENNFIYEFHEGDMKIAFDTQKSFGLNFVRFFSPSNPSEAINILKNHTKKLGLGISNDGLYQIYTLQNESLYLSSSELNKIANFKKNINDNEISDLVFSLNGVSFEIFFDKIITSKSIKDDYFSYIQSPNFSEIFLINALYKSFFRLFKIQGHIKINGKLDMLKAIGYAPPPMIAKKLESLALSIKTEIYMDIFKSLNEIEYDIKIKNNIDKETFLLSALLSLQNLISKNRKY